MEQRSDSAKVINDDFFIKRNSHTFGKTRHLLGQDPKLDLDSPGLIRTLMKLAMSVARSLPCSTFCIMAASVVPPDVNFENIISARVLRSPALGGSNASNVFKSPESICYIQP